MPREIDIILRKAQRMEALSQLQARKLKLYINNLEKRLEKTKGIVAQPTPVIDEEKKEVSGFAGLFKRK